MSVLAGKTIMMRLAEPEDGAFIVSLRTDPEKSKHLSPVSSSVDDQVRWLRAYKLREKAGTEYYFIITTLDLEPCGAVRIYNIHGETFTWGSWITSADAPRKAAFESAVLLYRFAFEKLCLSSASFDVRLENTRVIAFHDRFGARRTGSDAVNQYFTYSRAQWLADRARYAAFIPDLAELTGRCHGRRLAAADGADQQPL